MRLRSEYQQGILNILKKDGWPHKLISLENIGNLLPILLLSESISGKELANTNIIIK